MNLSVELRVCNALLGLLALLPLAAANAAEIFRCAGPNGQPVYQQSPCEQGQSSATSPVPAVAAPPHASNSASPPTSSGDRCEQVAKAIRRIGDGFRAGELESALRKQLAGQIDAGALQQGFVAFALAGSVSIEDLALFGQLMCESQTPLPPPQPWHLNQNGIAIRLQGWQQHWKWPSSWRLLGVREQPGFQLELAFADFDAAHLRVGCRAHTSHDRLDGKGYQLLALWAEQFQPGASRQTAQNTGTLNRFGNRLNRDPTSKRELYSAQLPRTDVSKMVRQHNVPEVSIALTPERLCVTVRNGELVDDTMERQARTMVELLLTNKPSPFAEGK